MEFRLFCPSCGQKLKAEVEDAGRKVDCPHCGVEFSIPHPEPVAPPPSLPVEPQRDSAIAPPNGDGDLSCPVCWLRFDTGDVMHIAVHDSLRGDPLLGEDAQQGQDESACWPALAGHALIARLGPESPKKILPPGDWGSGKRA